MSIIKNIFGFMCFDFISDIWVDNVCSDIINWGLERKK